MIVFNPFHAYVITNIVIFCLNTFSQCERIQAVIFLKFNSFQYKRKKLALELLMIKM